jgi:hypothetical protein
MQGMSVGEAKIVELLTAILAELQGQKERTNTPGGKRGEKSERMPGEKPSARS